MNLAHYREKRGGLTPFRTASELRGGEKGDIVNYFSPSHSLSQSLTIDALSNRTTTLFDAAGNVTSVKDADNNVTTFAFDADNRKIQMTDPLGHVATFAYDSVGNLTSTTDRDGRVGNPGHCGFPITKPLCRERKSGLGDFFVDHAGKFGRREGAPLETASVTVSLVRNKALDICEVRAHAAWEQIFLEPIPNGVVTIINHQ
jgi:YD repeat-containing protein